MNVYLEVGRKRVFAAAVDWPGWCRGARDEEGALQALVDYGPRYRRAIGRRFRPPSSEPHIVERVQGDATTDFGAPGVSPGVDERPLDGEELDRQLQILRACWRAFDRAADAAGPLRPGPRGGGRDVAKMTAHVHEATLGYVAALGGKRRDDARAAFLEAVGARARGELPDVGPRGGRRWNARFAIRREAWHALDHAWEIEDRSEPR